MPALKFLEDIEPYAVSKSREIMLSKRFLSIRHKDVPRETMWQALEAISTQLREEAKAKTVWRG